jgi:Ser/Thr protein kinase RdoA (MazF antagonist)
MRELRPRIREHTERLVSARFDRFYPLNEHADKAIYRGDLRADRAVIVRVFSARRPLERVRGDFAILEHVVRSGIPAEQPIAVSELDGRGLIVTAYVHGRPLADRTSSLRRFGAIVGKLSVLAPLDGDRYLGRRAGSVPAEDLAHARRELASGTGPLADALARTHPCDDLPTALIHTDCQLSNVISDPRKRLVVIDWEGAGVGPRLAPLGLALFSAAAGDRRRIAPVIEGFARHGAFTDLELERLPDLIRIRALCIAVRRGDSTGWWSRYREAEQIGDHAQRLLARSHR